MEIEEAKREAKERFYQKNPDSKPRRGDELPEISKEELYPSIGQWVKGKLIKSKADYKLERQLKKLEKEEYEKEYVKARVAAAKQKAWKKAKVKAGGRQGFLDAIQGWGRKTQSMGRKYGNIDPFGFDPSLRIGGNVDNLIYGKKKGKKKLLDDVILGR
jgi:hypothetical protein